MKKPAFNFFLGIMMSLLSLSAFAQWGGGPGGDCDCDPNVFEPVCVADEEGNVFLFESACLAECFGLTVLPEDECGLLGGGGDPGNGGGGDLPCDCEPDFESPVCVMDEMGNIFIFPDACLAECEGLEIVGDGDCELGGGGDPGNGGGGDLPCDCEPDFENPVCVMDEMGNIFIFPDACLAECEGFEIVGDGDCEFGGGGNDFPCDCDPDVYDPVCVIDPMGFYTELPNACIAECLGVEIIPEEDCNYGGGGDDPIDWECDCDPNEFDPVCVDDGEGNIFEFPSACLAECLGLSIANVEDCEFLGGGGGGDFPCDCDPDVFDPVCVVDEMGNILILPNACIAECEGFEIVGEGDCDLGGGGDPGNGGGGNGFPCDCDPNEFAPVCVADEEGNVFVFESACLAECFGLTVLPEDECDLLGGGGDPGNGGGGDFPCDCDPDVFDPVCVVDEMGNILILPNACIAECEGFEIVGEGDCDLGDFPGGGNDDPIDWECDCDPNEFDPVCVDDGEGNIFPFPSACIAECFGLTVVDGDCEFGDFPGDLPDGLPGGCLVFDEEQYAGLAPAQGGNTAPGGSDFGFDGMAAFSGLTTYPNPVQHSLNVSISSTDETKASVEVMNMAGQVMFSQQTIVQKGTQQIELNTSELVPGMYLLRITPENGSPVTEKVMKN